MQRFAVGAALFALVSIGPIQSALLAQPADPLPGSSEPRAECESAMAFHRAGRHEENGITRYECIENGGSYVLEIRRIAG